MKRIALIVLLLVIIVGAEDMDLGDRDFRFIGKKSLQSLPRTGPTNTAFHLKMYGSEMTTTKVDASGSGQLFDYSLNGALCELFGSSLVPAYPGFFFDGTQDHVFTDTTLQTTFDGSFSISCWCKTDDGNFTAYQVLVGAQNGAKEDIVHLTIETSGKVRLTYESNNISAYAEENAASFANGANPWVHVVGVATADTTLVIYVNGALQTLGAGAAAGDASGITFADFATNCDINVGGLNSDTTHDGFSKWFDGLIGETIIYNTALDAVQVKNIYETTKWRYPL